MALLDIKLADGPVTPVANALTAQGVPFVLVTGASDPALLDGMASAPRVAKPFAWADVEEALSDSADRRSIGRVYCSSASPRGGGGS